MLDYVIGNVIHRDVEQWLCTLFLEGIVDMLQIRSGESADAFMLDNVFLIHLCLGQLRLCLDSWEYLGSTICTLTHIV